MISLLALDSETELIRNDCKAPPLICVSWADGSKSGLWKWDGEGTPFGAEMQIESYLRWALAEPGRLIIGEYIAYDMAVWAAEFPALLPLIFEAYAQDKITDIGIRQKLIDIANGELDSPRYRVGKGCYSLEALEWRYFQRKLDKETYRLRYGELRHVKLADWDAGARDYAIKDAEAPVGIFHAQEPEAHYLADQFRQARHSFWLRLMTCWGVVTDAKAVDDLEECIRRDLARCKADLIAAGLLRPKNKKPDSPYSRFIAAAKERMIKAKGGEENCKRTDPSESYPQGQIALDEEACRESGDPLLEKYADYTSLAGMISKDIAALRQGRIHTKIDSLLETGRVSSSGNADNGGYNTTNMPREGGVRECFVPRPGCLFIDADYDGLELRTMAQACLELVGESAMADVLNAGRDVHLELGAELLGLTWEEALKRKSEKAVKEARQTAKPGNFGLAGGMGIPRFIAAAKKDYGIILTPEQAVNLKQTWLRKWPEFRLYFARAAEMTADGGYAQAEQLFAGRFRGELSYTEFCNTYFQGLGADAAKAAGWAISRACYDPTQNSILYGCRIVIFAHDQFIVETPADELAHERAKEVGRIMCEEANKWLPDVPATTTPCLVTCFSKGATALYDENGRLIPWDPRAMFFVDLFKWVGGIAANQTQRQAA